MTYEIQLILYSSSLKVQNGYWKKKYQNFCTLPLSDNLVIFFHMFVYSCSNQWHKLKSILLSLFNYLTNACIRLQMPLSVVIIMSFCFDAITDSTKFGMAIFFIKGPPQFHCSLLLLVSISFFAKLLMRGARMQGHSIIFLLSKYYSFVNSVLFVKISKK